MKKAVAYARFSSDMQREESIDAQVRAIKFFSNQYGYELAHVYADRAQSGRSDARVEFKQMISDSASGAFDAVIVHKLDRFSRSSSDAIYYERILNHNGVHLVSVIERLDSSPEGQLMKMVILGMNQMYSQNLAREVMKGLKENAYQCRHTGGTPPLGYDVVDGKYVINELEAQAVRMIFQMYAAGAGYGEIIQAMYENGFKTKRGNRFGKNSLYDLLRNEKYTGVYIFNKSVSADIRGKYNRHALKPADEIIRVENGIPQIVDKNLFWQVQQKMNDNKHKNARHKAKVSYLLSGKLYCGHCGHAMTGEMHRYRDREYGYYVCSSQKNKKGCNKKSVRKEWIEQAVVDDINNILFKPERLQSIAENIYKASHSGKPDERLVELKKQVAEIDRKIGNLTRVLADGLDSESVRASVVELENERRTLSVKIYELDLVPDAQRMSVAEIKNSISKMADFSRMDDSGKKRFIELFIQKIYLYDSDDGFRIRTVLSVTNPVDSLDISDFPDFSNITGSVPSPPKCLKTACFRAFLLPFDLPFRLCRKNKMA